MEKNWPTIWEEFYKTNARSFWLHIYKICGDEDMADEIFQESWVKFLRVRPVVANEYHMRSYLYKIALRLMIDKRRRIKTEKKALEEHIHAPQSGVQPARQDAETVFSSDMDKIFRKLKTKQRILLWLAYVEGYSHREIADLTNSRESSLKVQLFRAREKLAGLLREKGYEGGVKP